jgi:hypothetical protein
MQGLVHVHQPDVGFVNPRHRLGGLAVAFLGHLLIHEPEETVPRQAQFSLFCRAFRKKWDTSGEFLYQT